MYLGVQLGLLNVINGYNHGINHHNWDIWYNPYYGVSYPLLNWNCTSQVIPSPNTTAPNNKHLR